MVDLVFAAALIVGTAAIPAMFIHDSIRRKKKAAMGPYRTAAPAPPIPSYEPDSSVVRSAKAKIGGLEIEWTWGASFVELESEGLTCRARLKPHEARAVAKLLLRAADEAEGRPAHPSGDQPERPEK